MSKITSILNSIWKNFSSKEYRDAYVSAEISNGLAAQIYALRSQRGISQADLARAADMKQPRISKLENSCDGVSVETLKRIASAFDVALSIKFISFSRFAIESELDAPDRKISPFALDIEPIIASSNYSLSSIIVPSGTISKAVLDADFPSDVISTKPVVNFEASA